MSNYTQLTFFQPKDSLLSGNPAKLIRGADVDPELAAIATAIATKYDSASIVGATVPFGVGSAAAPSITFSGNTSDGIYHPAAGQVGVTTAGSLRLTVGTGVQVGAPTGGDKGAGTLNATGLYVNGTAVATAVSANPSATIGLSAVNGTATTFMTSDSAPALSQAISPTWSALHIFTGGVEVGAPTGGSKGANTINSPIANTYLDGTAFQAISPTWSGTHTFSNAITVNGAGSSLKGGVTIAAPASGAALTINGLASGAVNTNISWSTADTNPGSLNTAQVQLDNTNTTSGAFSLIMFRGVDSGGTPRYGGGIAAVTSGRTASGYDQTLQFYTRNAAGAVANPLTLGNNGSVTINAPSSGTALAVSGLTAANVASFASTGAASSVVLGWATVFGASWTLSSQSTDPLILGTQGAASTTLITNSTARAVINSSGNVTINAPSSGVALAIGGVGGTTSTVTGYGPTAAAQVDMTPDTGTFTVTYTGMTTTVTGTAVWARNGNHVVLFLPAASGTSNATGFTATGMPAAIKPARAQDVIMNVYGFTNGGAGAGTAVDASIATSGTITFNWNGSATGWTSSNTKGVATAQSIAYLLN